MAKRHLVTNVFRLVWKNQQQQYNNNNNSHSLFYVALHINHNYRILNE